MAELGAMFAGVHDVENKALGPHVGWKLVAAENSDAANLQKPQYIRSLAFRIKSLSARTSSAPVSPGNELNMVNWVCDLLLQTQMASS